MDKPVVATLLQRLGPGRSQEMVLHEDEVRVNFRSSTTLSRRTVPLEVIDPNETSARAFPAWTGPIVLIGAGAALVAALWAVRVGSLLWPVSAGPATWIAASAAVVAVLAGALHYFLAKDTIYFYSAYSGEFLFAVLQNRPDRQVVADFAAKIKELSRRRYDELKGDAERPSFARELEALHRLREKKIISPDEFDRKKFELLEEVLRE